MPHLPITVCICSLQAMRNTKMLAAYASIDERVRILGYTVKHFAKVRVATCALFGSSIIYD